MALELLKLPARDIQDVPRGLRALADSIEAGEFGGARNLAWVIDLGDGRVKCGALGAFGEPKPSAYLLFGKAMRALESD